jgi:SAM-dependent methyltransferase
MSERGGIASLERDWSRLAEADALWAICVDPAKRGGRWNLAEFLASGVAEISQVMADLDRLRLAGERRDALDFGCGVGRITAALTTHFGAVTGVDISLPMIERARAIHSASPRCRFILNAGPDLSAFDDHSFDLVYSSLVLQHLPPALAAGYLAEFIRVARPAGTVVIVVPEAHYRTARGLVYAYAPQALIRWLQRRVFGYPAPMRMHTMPSRRVRELAGRHGARVVASLPRPLPGHWRMVAHYITASQAPGEEPAPAS